MKCLLIYEDIFHPADRIDEALGRDPMPGVELTCMRNARTALSASMLREYPVVIIAGGNKLAPEAGSVWFEEGVAACMPGDFQAYVQAGGGLVVVHGGLAIARSAQDAFADVSGAYFMGHPPQETARAHVVMAHPITEGVRDFAHVDELYQIVLTREDAQVFLEYTSEHGGTMPGGYCFENGKGRVAALSPGHTLAVWQDAQFRTLLRNAILYCARKETTDACVRAR